MIADETRTLPESQDPRRMPGPLMATASIIRGEWSDLARGWYLPILAVVWLAICLAAADGAIAAIAGAAPALSVAAATLADISLLMLPLAGAVTGAIAFSSDGDAIDVLCLQPVSRAAIWTGRLLGQGSALLAALAPGWLITFMWLRHGGSGNGTGLFLLAILISAHTALVFLGLGALAGALLRDRLRTVGTAVVIWAAATVLWDALLMGLALVTNDVWFETTLPALVLASPVDAARVAFLVASRSRAFSGPAGAALAWFFGHPAGAIVLAAILLLWLLTPVACGLWVWNHRDF